MKVAKYRLKFYTSYRQFYIADRESDLSTDSLKFWTQEASESRLAIEEGVLGIGTECYGLVKATLIIQSEENLDFDPSIYDHIVEGSLKVSSGYLHVLTCPDMDVELKVKLDPGIYRVRVYSSNLSSVEGDEGDDFYRLEVWPNEYQERKVIVKYLY